MRKKRSSYYIEIETKKKAKGIAALNETTLENYINEAIREKNEREERKQNEK